MHLLNSRLYHALERMFGRVGIVNEGEAAQYVYVDDEEGKKRLRMIDHGESYHVNCPECGDSRGRLYFCHLWGWKDKYNNRNLWLMKCFNERCYQSDADASSGLLAGGGVRLTSGGTRRRRRRRGSSYDTAAERRESMYRALTTQFSLIPSRVKIAKGRPVKQRKLKLPDDIIPVHQLDPSHEAQIYLREDRKLDPDLVSKLYGLVYCQDDDHWPNVDKIIAPIFFNGKVVGYQARPPFECDWKEPGAPLKWWTHPATKRRAVLYNYDLARRYKTGVIVEGPGDVWKAGPMCHALLGSSFTPNQRQLFHRAHRSGSGVLLLDPEEYLKEKVIDDIKRWAESVHFAHGFAIVKLPDGFDPGSLDPTITRKIIKDQAAAQGVKVSFRLKDKYAKS